MKENRKKEYSTYVLTGINRLTGEREQISNPHSLTKVREILARLRPNRKQAYLKIEIEPAVRQGCILFGG